MSNSATASHIFPKLQPSLLPTPTSPPIVFTSLSTSSKKGYQFTICLDFVIFEGKDQPFHNVVLSVCLNEDWRQWLKNFKNSFKTTFKTTVFRICLFSVKMKTVTNSRDPTAWKRLSSLFSSAKRRQPLYSRRTDASWVFLDNFEDSDYTAGKRLSRIFLGKVWRQKP